MSDNNLHEANETCLFRFNALEQEVDMLKDKHEKRLEKENIIERAILEIQIASSLTAKTLEKFEGKFELFMQNSVKTKESDNDKWFKLAKDVLLIGGGIIGALLGVKLIG